MPKTKYTLSQKKADKHWLYQWAVQDAEHELELALEQYESRRGKPPRVLREDFCGTALVACQWVKSHADRRAIGLDLDPPTLQWAQEHNIEALGADDASRIELRCCDVRTVTEPKADVIQAFNFSYFLLHSLPELIEYFRCVRGSLAPGGIFMLDCFGGWEYQQPQRDRRTIETPKGTFGFVWEHGPVNPITNRAACHIHFAFKGNKRWKNAFDYQFRLYSLPEVRDALTAAGFTSIDTLWDVAEDDDYSDFRVTLDAENCPRWIAYVVAEAGEGGGRE